MNYCRIGYGLVMGVPAYAFNVIVLRSYLNSSLLLLLYAALGFGLGQIMRRWYHPAAAWFITTVDTVFVVGGMWPVYLMNLDRGESVEAYSVLLGGIHLQAMLIIAVNMLRFSWPIAVYTAVLAAGLAFSLSASVTGVLASHFFGAILYAGLTAVLVVSARRFREVVVRVKERDAFARFLPAPAIERVVRDPSGLNLGGEVQFATVLFTDIRDFTALSSAMKPERVVAMLNEYFAEMVSELFKHGGTLDKFIGDGLVAVFAPPLSPAAQTEAALRCTLGMTRRLEGLNERRVARGEPPLRMGAGIHSGTLLAGNIGTPERMEYTHIGDAVNTCSRIESLTKQLGESILVSEAAWAPLHGSREFVVRELPAVSVRGKTDALKVFAVDAPKAETAPPAAEGTAAISQKM